MIVQIRILETWIKNLIGIKPGSTFTKPFKEDCKIIVKITSVTNHIDKDMIGRQGFLPFDPKTGAVDLLKVIVPANKREQAYFARLKNWVVEFAAYEIIMVAKHKVK